MATPNTILIDSDLSTGGSLTPSSSPLFTTIGDDFVVLTSLGGTGSVANWTVLTIDGNDTVEINGSVFDSNVSLGSGDDVFDLARFGLGGSINTSSISGNAGDDILNLLVTGNGGALSRFGGGKGDDLINLSGNFTNVTVAGGEGNDSIEFLSPGLFTGSSIVGGLGNDNIVDNGHAINFSGSSIGGGQGSDFINVSSSFVGLGAEGLSILGGAGFDFLYGTFTGQNTIGGGKGNDFIQAFDGDDLLRGGIGNDTIIASFGNDSVYGGDGDDVIFGINGSNKIFAEAGDDFVAGGLADDSIDGGAGNDILAGGAGNDTINGGDGNDIIFGSDIFAQTGDGFIIVPGAPPVTLDTIATNVQNLYDTNAGAANLLAIGTPVIPATAGVLNFNGEASFEAYDNFLTGGIGDDIIFGGLADDTIKGGSGNDTIIGGTGSDVMSGGIGSDVFVQGIDDASSTTASFAASFPATNLTGGVLPGSNYLFTWTGNAPDIITDFVANSGTSIVDRIAFESELITDDWAGSQSPGNVIAYQNTAGSSFLFVDATNTPDVATAADQIVVFSGVWDGNNQTFAASYDGPDAMAFVATGDLKTVGAAAAGNQAVILLGAGTQSFQAGNFAFA